MIFSQYYHDMITILSRYFHDILMIFSQYFHMWNVDCQMSIVKCQTSNVECWVLSVKCQMSDVEYRVSDVEHRMSSIEYRMSNVECRMSIIELKESKGNQIWHSKVKSKRKKSKVKNWKSIVAKVSDATYILEVRRGTCLLTSLMSLLYSTLMHWIWEGSAL